MSQNFRRERERRGEANASQRKSRTPRSRAERGIRTRPRAARRSRRHSHPRGPATSGSIVHVGDCCGEAGEGACEARSSHVSCSDPRPATTTRGQAERGIPGATCAGRSRQSRAPTRTTATNNSNLRAGRARRPRDPPASTPARAEDDHSCPECPIDKPSNEAGEAARREPAGDAKPRRAVRRSPARDRLRRRAGVSCCCGNR
jgi:hypothetical protein